MSPLGQSPNFLTDGSRIRRPPVDDTKNPTFRRHPLTSKNFQYPASGRSPDPSSRLVSFIRACAAFLSRFRHFCPDIYLIANYYYLSLSNIRFPGNRPPFFCPSIFRCRFSKKAPRSFLCSALLPPCQFPCSLICRLFPVQRFSPPGAFAVFHPLSPTFTPPRSPLRPAFPFFAGIGRNGPPLSPPSHPLSRSTCPRS